jgi:hypothetical protein
LLFIWWGMERTSGVSCPTIFVSEGRRKMSWTLGSGLASQGWGPSTLNIFLARDSPRLASGFIMSLHLLHIRRKDTAQSHIRHYHPCDPTWMAPLPQASLCQGPSVSTPSWHQ